MGAVGLVKEQDGGGDDEHGVAQKEEAEIGGRIFFAEAAAGDVQPAPPSAADGGENQEKLKN